MSLKGRKLSEAHKAKISVANKGKPKSEAHKAALKANHKGIMGMKQSAEWIKNRITARRNNGTYIVTPEARTKMRMAKLGKPAPHARGKRSDELRRKLSLAHKGIQAREKHPNWKGGKDAKANIARRNIDYRLWRETVFQRDNYTCQDCHKKNEVGGKLNAHHIKAFAYFPELRYEISNGITLCIDCHQKTENWGCKKRII